MIRFFIYALFALLAGMLLSGFFGEDPGYVLMTFRGYSVETSLVVTLMIILLIFVLVFLLIWLLKIPVRIARLGNLNFFNRKLKARSDTEKGLLLLTEGRSQEAYKLLLQNAGSMESPLINYLAAAFAAFREGDRTSWMYCLEQAKLISGEDRDPIESVKAQLEFESGRLEQSLAIVLELRKRQPGNKYFLGLLKDIYLSLSDWAQLEQILPELEKHKMLTEEELSGLTVQVYLFQLEKALEAENAAGLETVWERIPKKYRRNESLLVSYAGKLITRGDDAAALGLLTQSLKHQWNDNLVALIGYIGGNDPRQQLLWLEKWIKDRPNNAVLAMTLGRLCLRNQRWGQGREYFEKALRMSQNKKLTAEINAELGRLFEHLGEHGRSVACYQQALGLLDKKLPDLPMPS